MNSDFICGYCGNSNIRRSRRKSVFEFLKMTFGSYPFRCLDCNARFFINIWLFSHLAYAKCPRCLRMRLTYWPRHFYRVSFWKNLQMTFGAHRYRCAACRHNFLSFRPLAPCGDAATYLVAESDGIQVDGATNAQVNDKAA